jgi:hypothetical protein
MAASCPGLKPICDALIRLGCCNKPMAGTPIEDPVCDDM